MTVWLPKHEKSTACNQEDKPGMLRGKSVHCPCWLQVILLLFCFPFFFLNSRKATVTSAETLESDRVDNINTLHCCV